MKLTETYSGQNERFEGDLTLWLRTLPVGAVATRAVVTLAPPQFSSQQETITFSNGQGELGAVKRLSGNDLEVDFRARRTLAAVTPRPGATGTATLQVDMGGAYVGVAQDGTFNSSASPWQVNFDPPNPQLDLPGLTVTRFKLHQAPRSFNLASVSIRSVASNLQVSLGQMAPFWVHLGELSKMQTSPDFADVLNFFLTTTEAQNGFYHIPLVVHSDTLARLDITLSIDYLLEQSILPPHLSEVDLPYDFSTLPGSEEGLLTVRLPRGAVPVEGRTSAAIRGTFDPSRLAMGEAGAMPALGALTLSPHCTLAQALTPTREIELTAVDLPLANTQPGLAGLHLSLMSDADGKPTGEILASAEVSVGKELPDGSVWGSADLAEALRLLPGERYWLVVQSRDGEAFWSVDQGDALHPPLQCSRDGGLSWRTASGTGLAAPLAAEYRLRHMPQRFSLPVQLQIGEGPSAVRRRLDEYAAAGKIEFSFDFAQKLREHLDQPEVSGPSPDQPPLCNPDFALPGPQDATRRLFGFDSFCYWMINSNVDLSRGLNLSHERYIRLSIGDGPPVRIDCAGAEPRRTQAEEIVGAINRTLGETIATLTVGASGAGRFLTLQSASGANLCLHPWCGQGLPECWQGTASHSHRVRLNATDFNESRTSLLLAGPSLIEQGLRTTHLGGLMSTTGLGVIEQTWRPACFAEGEVSTTQETQARLSQEFAVAPGVEYLLQLRYGVLEAAPATECSPCAPQGCAPCSPEGAQAPRWEVGWFDAAGNSLEIAAARLDVMRNAALVSPGTLLEARLTPPQDAVRGELRLLHEAADSYALLLDELSLHPTTHLTRNGDFSRWETLNGVEIPEQWHIESGWVEQHAQGGMVLRGDGPEEAILSQEFEVTAGTEFRLRMHALSTAVTEEARPLEERARFELLWRGRDLATLEALTLPLDERGFGGHAWQGSAPAGAAQAELRLVQPRGQSALRIAEVRLEKIDTLAVPLTFLGESPGRLKVSDLKVTYDLPAKPPRAVTRGVAQTSQIAQAFLVSSLPPGAGIALAALAEQPVIHISGVGPRYMELLERQQITTIGELARLHPARQIEGIPPGRLLEIKAAAELVLEGAGQCLSFPMLAEYTVGELMALSTEELARLSGQPLERAARLHKGLRTQHLLLDNHALRTLTLGQLAGDATNKKDRPA